MYQLFFLNIKWICPTIILLSIFFAGEVQGQNSKQIDSLKELLRTSREEQKFTLEYELFKEYTTIDKDQALIHIKSALEYARLSGDSLGIVKASHGLGWILRFRGDLREAIKIFEPALAIAKRNNMAPQVKYLLNNLALTYTSNASYDKALACNFESLGIREKEGNANEISVALNNIGLVYFELRDFENAVVYYDKSYQVKIANHVSYDLERSLINLGLAYNELGKFDIAEIKLKDAFAVCDSTDCAPDILAEAHQALGIALFQQGEYVLAEENFMKSLKLSQQVSILEYLASNFYWLAELRYQQGRMEEAVDFLDQSQKVCEKMDYRKMILGNYNLYSKIYSNRGDLKETSRYQKLYIELYGKIFNADLIKNISRIQTEHQERENIKTIAEKDEILELNKEVIAQQRIFNWLLGAVILLTSVLGYVIYRNYTRIKVVNTALGSANEALASAKKIIEDHNRLLDSQVQVKTQELADTNEALVKVNDELDNFIYKTSHDIRGPLASLKGIVNLAIMDVKDAKALGYLDKLDLTAEKLNTVLTRLLIVNRINHAELKPEHILFESIIQEILTLEMKKGVPPKIKIEYDVPPNIQLISDKEMVRLILENLIDNAVKFHNDSERIESFVRIAVRSENGNVTAHITDNGVGISEMNREKIFQMFVRASERSETGGIGLYLAKLATEKLGGEINLVSKNEKNTEFIVRFPQDLQAVIDRRKEEKRKIDLEKSQEVVKPTAPQSV